jgi:flagellar export protein FliJ
VFRLARLLAVRERRQQAAAVDLARAQEALEALEQTLAALEAARGQLRARQRTTPAGGGTAGLLQTLGIVDGHVAAQVRQVAQQVEAARATVARCHATLLERTRERRVLELLRDKQRSAGQQEEDRRERQVMDEIALHRYRPETRTTDVA